LLPKILALPARIQVLMMTKDMKAGWPKKGASKKNDRPTERNSLLNGHWF